jgi:hypothetical protein
MNEDACHLKQIYKSYFCVVVSESWRGVWRRHHVVIVSGRGRRVEVLLVQRLRRRRMLLIRGTLVELRQEITLQIALIKNMSAFLTWKWLIVW